MKLQGQTFGPSLLERLRTAVREGVASTLTGLSRRLCEWLDWRSVNGRLREIDVRKALVALEVLGEVSLVAVTKQEVALSRLRDSRSNRLYGPYCWVRQVGWRGCGRFLGQWGRETISERPREGVCGEKPITV